MGLPVSDGELVRDSARTHENRQESPEIRTEATDGHSTKCVTKLHIQTPDRCDLPPVPLLTNVVAC